jgi:hypothetical protein
MTDGGYYLNVGCSDLIVEDEIGLLHYDDIERFAADGALMKDGSLEKADYIALQIKAREIGIIRSEP